jgi:hypothetical protein
MTIVFVFSRASDFIMRTSSFVHGRPAVIFFAISLPITKPAPAAQRRPQHPVRFANPTPKKSRPILQIRRLKFAYGLGPQARRMCDTRRNEKLPVAL